jgi:diketogulonate reductase-like aldo/keto reductase
MKYRLIIDEFGGWDLFQTLLGAIKLIAVKYGVSMSAVAARYVLECPQVAAVIIGARYAANLESTLSMFQFTLDKQDHKSISVVLQEQEGPSGPVYGLEGDRSGRHGRIMKYNLNTRSSL